MGTDVREHKIGSVVGGLCAHGSPGLMMIIYIYIYNYYFLFSSGVNGTILCSVTCRVTTDLG